MCPARAASTEVQRGAQLAIGAEKLRSRADLRPHREPRQSTVHDEKLQVMASGIRQIVKAPRRHKDNVVLPGFPRPFAQDRLSFPPDDE